MNCWRCHEPVQGPVCVGCGAIQPPRPDLDLFSVLGLPRRWATDPADVAAAWRATSRKVHPDRFAGKAAVERRMALQWTATVNQAKSVLTDDRARALYLVTGKPAPDESGGPTLDPDFLEAVFDLQMLAGSDPAAAAAQAESLCDQHFAAVDAALTLLDQGGSPDLTQVEAELARVRYLDKTLAQARAAT
jgi:molecular chaperone HscB